MTPFLKGVPINKQLTAARLNEWLEELENCKLTGSKGLAVSSGYGGTTVTVQQPNTTSTSSNHPFKADKKTVGNQVGLTFRRRKQEDGSFAFHNRFETGLITPSFLVPYMNGSYITDVVFSPSSGQYQPRFVVSSVDDDNFLPITGNGIVWLVATTQVATFPVAPLWGNPEIIFIPGHTPTIPMVRTSSAGYIGVPICIISDYANGSFKITQTLHSAPRGTDLYLGGGGSGEWKQPSGPWQGALGSAYWYEGQQVGRGISVGYGNLNYALNGENNPQT